MLEEYAYIKCKKRPNVARHINISLYNVHRGYTTRSDGLQAAVSAQALVWTAAVGPVLVLRVTFRGSS